jgi:hypothetical protein
MGRAGEGCLFLTVGRELLGQCERPKGSHREGELENTVASLLERPRAHLGADVVERDVDGAYVLLDLLDQSGDIVRGRPIPAAGRTAWCRGTLNLC